jgi:hypothetical protein
MSESFRVINKTRAKQFFIGDRELLREKRISADAKNIYIVLRSLSETCDNVCPSYLWIAFEIGYESTGKTEQATCQFISRKIHELVSMKMVQQLRKSKGFDYEVYDYDVDVVQESLNKNVESSLNKNVESSLNKNVDLVIREKKQENSSREEFKENKENQNLGEQESPPPDLPRSEISDEIKIQIRNRLELDEPLATRVLGLIELQFWQFYNEKGQKLSNPDNQFTSWCFRRWGEIEKIKREQMRTADYESRKKDYQKPKNPVKTELTISQRDGESDQKFNDRCDQREELGDVRVKKIYKTGVAEAKNREMLRRAKNQALNTQKTI